VERLIFTGPSTESWKLTGLIEAASDLGYELVEKSDIKGSKGVVPPRERQLETIGVNPPYADRLRETGISRVKHLTKLSLVDAWRRCVSISCPTALDRVAGFAAAHDLSFKDGPVDDYCQAVARHQAKTLIIPELGVLVSEIRMALGVNRVVLLHMLREISDRELANLRNLSKVRVALIRQAQRAYEAAHPER
jgi:hypothetical protein